MERSFSASDFIKLLSEGKIETPREPIVKEGLVKQADDDPGAIMFSEGSACGNWTKIASELIETIELVTTRRCMDHEHPFVRLTLKEPDPSNHAALLYYELLRRTMLQPVLPQVHLEQSRSLPASLLEHGLRAGQGRDRGDLCRWRTAGFHYELFVRCNNNVGYGTSDIFYENGDTDDDAIVRATHMALRTAGCSEYFADYVILRDPPPTFWWISKLYCP